jgi:hypothetical protein
MTFPNANRFSLTLTLARNCHLCELACWCGMPDAWAAGVMDAIDGLPAIWADAAPTERERLDFAAGYKIGQTLLNDRTAPELAAA